MKWALTLKVWVFERTFVLAFIGGFLNSHVICWSDIMFEIVKLLAKLYLNLNNTKFLQFD